VITTSDFKKGLRYEHEGSPWQVMEVTIHNPSARGAATLVKAKSRNLLTDQVLLKTFKAGETFDEPDLNKTEVSFLYDQGDDIVVMDSESYEQYTIEKSKIGEQVIWMVEDFVFHILWYEGVPIQFELPDSVEVKVSTVESGAKGDTASGKVLSRAVLENGFPMQVPSYVKPDSKIKINPRNGTFISRA